MWKKSEILKNIKFRILLLVELCLLCVGAVILYGGNKVVCDDSAMEIALNGGTYVDGVGYTVDSSSGIYGEWLTAEGFGLTPGSYDTVLFYEAYDNGLNNVGMAAPDAPFNSLLANGMSIYSGREMCRFQFYVTDWIPAEERPQVTVEYMGYEALTIRGIEIVKTNAAMWAYVVSVLAVSLLVNLLIMVYAYMGKEEVSLQQKLVWFGIPAMALLASFPVFVDYVMIGADAIFHVLRIEFLADALADGIFPVRIEPDWIFEHGYANSLFYCDTFLLLPAIMRMIGFPMTIAYAAFVIGTNLLTSVIAYISCKGMFGGNRYVGLFGSLLYTLAPYRVYNIYNRSAVGEFTAMTFLSLVCYGFYLLLSEDTKSKHYKKYWIVLMLGMSGIIQSHVLSCEIVAGFAALLCVIMIKRVLRKDTLIQLIKAVAGTVCLNLWFLLPFLDMMMAGEYKFAQNQGIHIQKRGILPANIFYTVQNAGGNSKFNELGMQDTEPIGVGIAILIAVVAFWALRSRIVKENEKAVRTGTVAFIIGGAGIVLSMCLFPWDTIQTWSSITGTLIPMIQFPTRLTLVPTACFIVTACAVAAWLLSGERKQWKTILLGAMICSSIFFSMYQTNDALDNRTGALRLHSAEGAGHSNVLGGEYLPLEADQCMEYHDAWVPEGVEVTAYTKENLEVDANVQVAAAAAEAWVELPMTYYKGYQAKDVATGQSLPVEYGTNGHVRVALQPGYSGGIHVWYAGMWYWHVAEAISVLFMLILAGRALTENRKCRKETAN